MKSIELTDSIFEGYASLEKGDGFIKPWRLPHDRRGLYPSPDDGLMTRAEHTSGVRLRFATDSEEIKLVCEAIPAAEEPNHAFDLTIEGELVVSLSCKGEEEYLFSDLPAGMKTVEIWLSQFHPVSVKALYVAENAEFKVEEDTRPKWITYGSSITHDRTAHSPSRTWPATVARAKNLNLTSLGFGGQCHIDGMVGQFIGEQEADFISLKLGINVHGNASLNARTFKSSVISLIYIIRGKHPNVPLAVISPIYSPPREKDPNAVGMTLEFMREEVEDAVKRIKETCGDENIYYFSGLDLFDESNVDNLPDGLHPDGDGYEIMGRNFVGKIYNKIF
ncbi:MAG: SGNH/GDSL hydrolase family protein [Planctomycetota bacterium]|jgi:hypothetical protein